MLSFRSSVDCSHNYNPETEPSLIDGLLVGRNLPGRHPPALKGRAQNVLGHGDPKPIKTNAENSER